MSFDVAAAPRCARRLGAPEDLPILAARLVELPHVGPLVQRLWSDPAVPSHLKNVVRTALLERGAKVVVLTPELRTRLGLDHDFAALYADCSLLNPVDARTMRSLARSKFANLWAGWSATVFARPPPAATRNARTQAKCDLNLLSSLVPAAFVQDRPLTRTENDFSSLLHELAHFRFNLFLETHVEALLRVLPRHLMFRAADGKVYIDREFYDFTSERYSVETEVSLINRTQFSYFKSRYLRYAPWTYGLDAHLSRSIAEAVIRSYEISDPRVRRLAAFSLFEIFRGKPFRDTAP